jgi:putative transposase
VISSSVRLLSDKGPTGKTRIQIGPTFREETNHRPSVFNTDQGSQFTSPRFTEVLTEAGVRISMDGRGRWLDNVFIERLWRSLKYECIYLNAFETGSEARAGIGRWITYYNGSRPHSALGGRTPEEAHMTCDGTRLAA